MLTNSKFTTNKKTQIISLRKIDIFRFILFLEIKFYVIKIEKMNILEITWIVFVLFDLKKKTTDFKELHFEITWF